MGYNKENLDKIPALSSGTTEGTRSFKVNQYQMQAIIHCLDLKNKPKRHTEIKQGAKSNPIHKYSTSVVEVVNKIMAQKGRDTFLKECENIYREHKLNNRKK